MASLLQGIALYVGYTCVVASIWRWRHVDYTRLAESTDRVRDGIVLPIGVGLLVVVGAVTWLGWWKPVLSQHRTAPTWALIVPVLLLLTALSGLMNIDWRSGDRRKLALIALGVTLVGCAEEILTRGVLVVGAQRAGWSAAAVCVFSTLLFSALHAINGLFGLPWRSVAGQLVLTALAGVALYVTLFSTGALIVCIVLHALWDFSLVGQAANDRKPLPISGASALLTYAAGLAALWPTLH